MRWSATTTLRSLRRVGTSNPLMSMLQEDAPKVRLRTIEDWGIPSGAKEAYAFALMGFLSVHGLPGNVPSCTGARSAVVLGSITLGRPSCCPTRPPGRQVISGSKLPSQASRAGFKEV
jgi:anhydro-N-acetylmuramic acid kinase